MENEESMRSTTRKKPAPARRRKTNVLDLAARLSKFDSDLIREFARLNSEGERLRDFLIKNGINRGRAHELAKGFTDPEFEKRRLRRVKRAEKRVPRE
jgi:hypothetical protein